eukprot:gene18446-35537_t
MATTATTTTKVEVAYTDRAKHFTREWRKSPGSGFTKLGESLSDSGSITLMSCCAIFDKDRSYIYVRENSLEMNNAYTNCCGYFCDTQDDTSVKPQPKYPQAFVAALTQVWPWQSQRLHVDFVKRKEGPAANLSVQSTTSNVMYESIDAPLIQNRAVNCVQCQKACPVGMKFCRSCGADQRNLNLI